MNAVDLFALFDVALVNQISEFSILSTDKSTKKTMFLRDVTTIENKFFQELFLFIGWLVEDINREMFFCKQCSIRFLHVQGNLDLMKISLSANSRCVIHILKTCEAWTKRCTVGWNDYYEMLRKDNQYAVNRSNSLDSLFSSLKMSDSRKIGRVTSSDNVKPRVQSAIGTMEENIQMLRTRYALTSVVGGNSLRRSRFSLRRSSSSGPTTGDPIIDESISNQTDPCGMSEILGIPSSSNCDSSTDIIQGKKMDAYSVSSALSATDGGSSSSASDANSDTHSSDGHYRAHPYTQELQLQQASNLSCEGIAMISNDATLSFSYLDPLSSTVDNRNNTVTLQSHDANTTAAISTLQRNDTVQSTMSQDSSVCVIDRSFSDDLVDLDMLLEVPLSPIATHNSHSGGSNDHSDGLDSKKKNTRVRVTTVKLSKLPKAADELCTLFRIKTEAIFNGDYLEKKFDRDFLFKRRFIWIDPSTRSINWAKSSEERVKNPRMSKFLLLKRFYTRKRVTQGQSKGVAHDVTFDAGGLTVWTEGGQQLTIKIPIEAQQCWQRIVLILRN